MGWIFSELTQGAAADTAEVRITKLVAPVFYGCCLTLKGRAMKPKQIKVAVMAAAALIAFAAGLGVGLGLGAGLGSSAGSAPNGGSICTANPCRITMTRNGSDGLVIKDAAGPKVENAFLIIDPSGLAEFWQNASGAYEGPRGEICTTNSGLAPVACLGGDGTAGWVRIGNEVLTSGDLAWMHRAEGATRPAVSLSGRAELAKRPTGPPIRQ